MPAPEDFAAVIDGVATMEQLEAVAAVMPIGIEALCYSCERMRADCQPYPGIGPLVCPACRASADRAKLADAANLIDVASVSAAVPDPDFVEFLAFDCGTHTPSPIPSIPDVTEDSPIPSIPEYPEHRASPIDSTNRAHPNRAPLTTGDRAVLEAIASAVRLALKDEQPYRVSLARDLITAARTVAPGIVPDLTESNPETARRIYGDRGSWGEPLTLDLPATSAALEALYPSVADDPDFAAIIARPVVLIIPETDADRRWQAIDTATDAAPIVTSDQCDDRDQCDDCRAALDYPHYEGCGHRANPADRVAVAARDLPATADEAADRAVAAYAAEDRPLADAYRADLAAFQPDHAIDGWVESHLIAAEARRADLEDGRQQAQDRADRTGDGYTLARSTRSGAYFTYRDGEYATARHSFGPFVALEMFTPQIPIIRQRAAQLAELAACLSDVAAADYDRSVPADLYRIADAIRVLCAVPLAPELAAEAEELIASLEATPDPGTWQARARQHSAEADRLLTGRHEAAQTAADVAYRASVLAE